MNEGLLPFLPFSASIPPIKINHYCLRLDISALALSQMARTRSEKSVVSEKGESLSRFSPPEIKDHSLDGLVLYCESTRLWSKYRATRLDLAQETQRNVSSAKRRHIRPSNQLLLSFYATTCHVPLCGFVRLLQTWEASSSVPHDNIINFCSIAAFSIPSHNPQMIWTEQRLSSCQLLIVHGSWGP